MAILASIVVEKTLNMWSKCNLRAKTTLGEHKINSFVAYLVDYKTVL